MVNRRSWINDTTLLTGAGTLDGNEVVRVIDDPSGTPTSKKTTVSGISTKVISDLEALGTTIEWEGDWLTATDYVAQAGVANDGSSYICILAHTSGASSEPGVGGSWETYWDVLAAKGDTGDQGDQGLQGTVGPDGQGDLNWTQPRYFNPNSGTATGGAVIGPEFITFGVGPNGRYFRINNFNVLGFPDGEWEGKTILLEFTLESGTVPATKTWQIKDGLNNTGTELSTGSFTLNGNRYEAEVTVPVGALSLMININAGTTPAVITRPTYRFQNDRKRNIRSDETIFIERTRLNKRYKNYFGKGFAPSLGAGSGTPANNDGVFFVPAGAYAVALITGAQIPAEATVTCTFRATLDSDGSPTDLLKSFVLEARNETDFTQSQDVSYISNGWYTGTFTIGSAVGITDILKLTVDNRAANNSSYTNVDINISDISFVEGTSLPEPGSNYYDFYNPDEVVVNVSADTFISFYHKGSNPDTNIYIEHQIERTEDAVKSSYNWTWQGSWTCVRTGEYSFERLYRITIGELVQVLYANGMSEGAGGSVHGNQSDQEANGFARLLLDGNIVSVSTDGWYKCFDADLQTGTMLFEDDGATELADLRQSQKVVNRKLVIGNFYTWEQSFLIDSLYACLPQVFRYLDNNSGLAKITTDAVFGPRWSEIIDVSNTGFSNYNGNTYGDASIVKMWGDTDISFEVKVTEGWTDTSREITIRDNTSSAKVYVTPIYNTSVTAGDEFFFECEIKITSNE